MEDEELLLKRPSDFLVFREKFLRIPVPPEAIIARGNIGKLFETYQLNGDPRSMERYSDDLLWKHLGWWRRLPGMPEGR